MKLIKDLLICNGVGRVDFIKYVFLDGYVFFVDDMYKYFVKFVDILLSVFCKGKGEW